MLFYILSLVIALINVFFSSCGLKKNCFSELESKFWVRLVLSSSSVHTKSATCKSLYFCGSAVLNSTLERQVDIIALAKLLQNRTNNHKIFFARGATQFWLKGEAKQRKNAPALWGVLTKHLRKRGNQNLFEFGSCRLYSKSAYFLLE